GEAQSANRERTVERRRRGKPAADDLGLGVQDLLDPGKARPAALQHRKREPQRQEGPGHSRQGQPEGEEATGRQAAGLGTAQKKRAAVPEEDQDAEGADRAHQWSDQAPKARQGEVGLQIGAIGLLEARALYLL